MSLIKTLFRATRIFWIISRLVLGLIFAYSAIFLLENADLSDYLSAAFFALVAIALFWSFVAGRFRGGAPRGVRMFSGIVLILMGVMLLFSSLSVFGFADAVLILLLPIWLLTAGLFELFGSGRRRNKLIDLPPSESPVNS